MGPYDDRRATLDPGLTALALRARRRGAAGRYPFVEAVDRPRGGWLEALRARLVAWRRRGAPGGGDAQPPA